MRTPNAYHVVISYGPQTIPNLEGGFMLRCFQHLSIPDLATLRCPWQDSRHTRGQFTPVLSSHNSPISRSVDYTFLHKVEGCILPIQAVILKGMILQCMSPSLCDESLRGQHICATSHGITLKRILIFKQITDSDREFCNSKSKSYEGFTVMSSIFNRDYSRK